MPRLTASQRAAAHGSDFGKRFLAFRAPSSAISIPPFQWMPGS